jgi:hypothetical protein
MKPDYQSMQVGDRLPMPILGTWEGANQQLYYEIQDYCRTADPAPQFEVETVRTPKVEFWLKRTR